MRSRDEIVTSLRSLGTAANRLRQHCVPSGQSDAAYTLLMLTNMQMAEAVIGDHPDRKALHSFYVGLASGEVRY